MEHGTDASRRAARRGAAPGRRPPMRVLGIATGLVGLALLVGVACSQVGGSGAAAPRVGLVLGTVDHVEGDAGTSTVPVELLLDTALRTPVTVTVATVDGTAKAADHDYEPFTRTLTIAPGQRTVTTTVSVVGDTRLEDYETFSVRLSAVNGATAGRSRENVRILNDDRPKVTMGGVRVGEGGVAVFRPHLSRRYYRTVTASAGTADGSALAPRDYTAVARSVVFPAGSTRVVPVGVSTAADATTEAPETFGLRLQVPDLATTVGAVGTIVETQCPSGAPDAAAPLAPAPASPSSARTSSPPAAVTGSRAWDVVFADDFDRPATTAATWATGMRSGALTLAGNNELEWYSPANSVVTTDSDGGTPISVLQQRLTSDPVPGEYYPVGVLSRLYPPARCPQYYDPRHLRPDDPSLVPYRFRSGMVNSAAHFAFTYGYVEARVRLPKGFALWPALWLRDWNAWSYELDALEGFDRDARTFRGTFWWGNGSHVSTSADGDLGTNADGSACRGAPPVPATALSAAECSLASSVDLSAGYHTIGLNWTATRYELYLDGVKRWTSPAGTPIASDPNHLILNLAFGNDADEFDWSQQTVRPLDGGLLTSALFPKPTVEWDYVRVWQPAGAHSVCTTGTC